MSGERVIILGVDDVCDYFCIKLNVQCFDVHVFGQSKAILEGPQFSS